MRLVSVSLKINILNGIPRNSGSVAKAILLILLSKHSYLKILLILSKLSYIKRIRRVGRNLVKRKKRISKTYFGVWVYLVSFIILLSIYAPQLHVRNCSWAMWGEVFYLITVRDRTASFIYLLWRFSTGVRLISI